MIRIAILDDHQIIIDGLISLLETEEDIQIELAGTDHRFFMEGLKNAPPIDVLLLDIEMGTINGIDLIPQIKKDCPDTEILMLTMHRESRYIKGAVQNGASGYLLKNSGKKKLLEGIRDVFNGKPTYSSEIMHGFFKGKNDYDPPNQAPARLTLTRKEKEVLRLIKKGLKNEGIATVMFVSLETVKTHRKNILAKGKSIGIKNMYEFLAYTIETGLIEGD